LQDYRANENEAAGIVAVRNVRRRTRSRRASPRKGFPGAAIAEDALTLLD
jgi:hypothetical protein